LSFLPGFGEFDSQALDKNVETIRGALSGFKADRMRTAGALLAIRSYVDYFPRDRGNRESLDNFLASIAIVRQRRADEGADPSGLDLFDKLQREASFKHQQSLVMVEKWNSLRAAELSDKSLTLWWEPHIPGHKKDPG
jgi:hypothetical protein